MVIRARWRWPGWLLDNFSREVSSQLRSGGSYSQPEVQQVVENTLSDFRAKYQEPFRVLLGHCGMLGMERFLYRSDENYLTPVLDHAHVGMGHSLWRFLTEMLFEPGNNVADNTRLAVFIMQQAIKYVDGVEGPIRVATYSFGDDFWMFKSPQEIKNIELSFSSEELKRTWIDYWARLNPPTLRDQLRKYGAVQMGDEPILLEGVKLQELYTIAGRRRASKIFARNTDKLQQRAIVEGKRYRAARSSASPSSAGETRT